MGHAACMMGIINPYKDLVRKCEGMRPRGRPNHRWENNTGNAS
jgi:hypothetical protein